MTRRRTRLAVAATALALGLAGCGPSEDELRRQVLDEALDATFDGPLAFTLELDAAEEELAAFGDEAGRLGQLLTRSRAAGVLEDDRVALALTLAGIDLVQARLVASDEVYVRSDLAGVARAVGSADGGALRTALEASLTEAGVDAAATDAVLAAVDGDWVRLEQPADDPPGDDDVTGDGGTVASALRALLEAGTITSHVGRLEGDDPFDGQFTLEVGPDDAAAAFLGALAGLDPTASLAAGASPPPDAAEPVRVVVVVTGGELRTLDAGLASVLGAVTGAERTSGTADVGVLVTLRGLSPEEPLVVAPDAPTSVTLDELNAAFAVLQDLVPGLAG